MLSIPGRRLLYALAVPAMAGCDPCSGLSLCGESHLEAVGLTVLHVTGEPAAGVVIRFEPYPGQSPSDTIGAVSGADGQFVLRGSSLAPEPVRGRLVFIPPPPYGFFAYAVEDVEMPVVHVRGGAPYIGSWGVGPLPGPPRIDYAGVLVLEDTGMPAEGVAVEIRRVGGLAMDPEAIETVSGGDGRFYIRPSVAGSGVAVVDVRVTPPEGYRPCAITALELPTFEVEELRLIGRWAVPVADSTTVAVETPPCEELPTYPDAG